MTLLVPTSSVMHIERRLYTIEGHQMQFEQTRDTSLSWVAHHNENVNAS